MKKIETFEKLSQKMDTLSENSKGQLKGGFAVLSSSELVVDLDDDTNVFCPTNNCRCTNRNKDKQCSGCSGTIDPGGR